MTAGIYGGFSIDQILEIVRLTLSKQHARGCVFTPNIIDEIAAEIEPGKPECETISKLCHSIKKREIYCPHEGIDRRAEFGLIP